MKKDFFTIEDYEIVKQQKNRCLILYIFISIVYMFISVGLVLWYTTLPYLSNDIWKIKTIHYTLTVIFVVFSFIYLGIKFRRVHKLYKVYVDNASASLDVFEGTFVDYEDILQTKDGVECKSIIFVEYNKYKDEYFERKVLIPYKKQYPEFKESQFVKYYTQNNFLIKYETED